MPSLEAFKAKNKNQFRAQGFALLREQVHRSIDNEAAVRLRKDPIPTKEELYMGAFKEWLEPQVRDAVVQMYKKGYATQSSGFDAQDQALQLIDGLFNIDNEAKHTLEAMGVEVMRGVDFGLPRNKLITIFRFRAKAPVIEEIKDRWDAIASALPKKQLPPGIRAICDRAEEFREQYLPQHPGLNEERARYLDYLRKNS
jgi:hypothetical protein